MKKNLIFFAFMLLVLGSFVLVSAVTCTDSDGGKDYYVKGTTVLWENDNITSRFTFTDSCESNDALREYYCRESEDGHVTTYLTGYLCSNGCTDGACNAPSIFKEQVKCVFDNSNGIQKCYTSEGSFGCSGVGTCVADVSGIKGTKQTWKSSCDGYAYTIIDGENEYAQFTCATNPEPVIITEQVKCIFDNSNEVQSCFAGDGKFICSGIESCVAKVSGEKGKQLSWLGTCEGDAETIIDGHNKQIEFNCVPPINENHIVKEQVNCVFKNALTDQKCYTAEEDLRFYCIGTDTCVVDVNGKKGEKLTWKSTCGGYQYTVQDENEESIYFDCSQGETNISQPVPENNAFRNAYWQCYDGKEFNLGGDSSCKPYGLWKKYATETCEARCSSGKEKCGVKSFALTNSCYSDYTGEKESNSTSEGASSSDCEEYAKECKGACNLKDSECVSRMNLACNKWNFNCNQLNESGTIPIETLICKDSCPLDGKCYNFGYRKSSNFCSDKGLFVEQLEGDKVCDNNFECSSNVCVSGKCVSEGFIQKVMSWFKRLFGG